MRSAIASALFATPSPPVVVGRYQLLELIGEGGMGVVYSAYDPQLDRKVALKLPRAHDRLAASRLVHEARALARIASPHVVSVYDVGEADKHTFCAMALVTGGDLRRVRLHPRAVLALGREIANGLAAAHDVGVVHRDIKPRNVLMDREGRAVLVDFGLASIDATDPFGGADPHGSSSRAGTPAYMAPEQIEGGVVDARCDQYSLCITLLELLRGCPLHLGCDADHGHAALRAGRVHAAVDRLCVDPSVAVLLHRGLAPEPDERFADMSELADELTALLAGSRRDLLVHRAGRVATALGVS